MNKKKKLTDAHKAKISASLMGRNKGNKMSEEAKRKVSVARLGKKHSAKAKAKMSASRLGEKKSEKHKARLSASLKAYWLKRKRNVNYMEGEW